MVTRLGLLALAPLVLVAACSAPSDDASTSAAADLTEGAWIQDNSPYYWVDSTFDEFNVSTASISGGWQPRPSAIDDADPLTVRLQAWLDRIDGVVRPAMEAKLGAPLAAPKPIAKVLQSKSTFNAWVSAVPVCLGSPFGGAHTPGTQAYLDTASIQPLYATCLKPPTWNTADAVKFWNADKPACSLTLTNGVLATRGGSSCAVDPSASGADDLMITSTGRYIQFTTDLLAEVDESTVAVVAAHELGHYYLGHTTARGASKYGFWYTRSAGQQSTPVRAANSAELEASYKEVIQAGRPLGGPSFASHYSARMRPLLLAGVAPLLSQRAEPGFVCAAARDALGPWTEQIRTGEAPPQEAQASFLDFEAKLARCAPQLALGGEPGARALSAGETLFAAARNRPGPKTKITTSLSDNLGAFLDRIDAQAKGLDAQAQRLVARLKDNSVGLYTTEQAADEFAMQMATKMGFSTDEVLAAWVDFMRAIDRLYARSFTPDQLATYRQQNAELDAETCSAMLASGFVKDGAPVTLSMGQLDEPHHPGCYRLFNLWREGRAHRFVAGARGAPLLPEWSTLRAEAAALAAQSQL
jgi:hypothetical protein